MPRQKDFKQTLRADIGGFSLHAAVRCAADDRQALEQLCRYITRPALANEHVQTNADVQVVLKLKTAWRDGATHLVMSPLKLMQRKRSANPILAASPVVCLGLCGSGRDGDCAGLDDAAGLGQRTM